MRKVRMLGATMVLMVTSTACTPLDDALAAVFGRSMRDQPSLDPYEQTLPPPEGSVAFAAGNFTSGPFEVNLGQPERGADIPDFTITEMLQNAPNVASVVNPVPATAESLARGEELYGRVCAVCHGDAGIGAEAYIVDKYPALVAYNPAGPTGAAYSEGYLYGMIRLGRGLMPAYGHQVTHFDRWHIVNYLRQLQRAAGNTPSIDQTGGN